MSRATRRLLELRFSCPYLKGEVELTRERERHIAERHPDLLPEHRDRLATTLAGPDTIRQPPVCGRQTVFAVVS
jgi:hypothetical protein